MHIIDNNIGNILIKHKNNNQILYLKDNLTFTNNRFEASKFYLLKSGNTNILNNDRISVNYGNKTLLINPTDLSNKGVSPPCLINNNTLRFVDRNNINYSVSTFVITSGSDSILPIQYDTPIFLLTDKYNNIALKYSHKTNSSLDLPLKGKSEQSFKDCLTNPTDLSNNGVSPHCLDLPLKGKSEQSLHDCLTNPTDLSNNGVSPHCLTNTKFDITTNINDLQFYLEKFDEKPITNIPKSSGNMNFMKVPLEINDNNKSIILLILLFIILFLCTILNR